MAGAGESLRARFSHVVSIKRPASVRGLLARALQTRFTAVTYVDVAAAKDCGVKKQEECKTSGLRMRKMYGIWNNVKTTLLLSLLMGLCLGIGYLLGGQAALLPALVIGAGLNFFAFFFSDRIALATMRNGSKSRRARQTPHAQGVHISCAGSQCICDWSRATP